MEDPEIDKGVLDIILFNTYNKQTAQFAKKEVDEFKEPTDVKKEAKNLF